ncbi:MAG: cation:proton antiporter [Acholeplasmataceae bacterium]|nr:cation:proton antiporter [Acholeplasmataceae bacterium]
MLNLFDKIFKDIGSTPAILISLGVMLFVGFLLTRLTKPLKLPNVTAYIFAGILIGPQVLGLVQEEVIDGLDFLTDLALAFIAFGVGRFFKLDILKLSGPKVIVITLFESLMAGLIIFLGMFFFFDYGFEFALLLAAIATATAPASTMMTIRQTKAKGHFVNTILQVVSLDDAISLILFSISIAIITAVDAPGGFNAMTVFLPILFNIGAIIVGFFWGFILHLFITKKRSQDNKLIIAISLIVVFTGLAASLDISPLLGVMAMGMSYVNLSKDEALFMQLDYFTPPILSLFFITSGMRLKLSMLASIGIVGVVYFVIRIIGKYAGASLGSVVARSTPENKKYLGLALIPQAGVSIGLAALGSRILIQTGIPELIEYADLLTTIIIASGILYEIFGPPSAKLSLYLSKSYDPKELEKERHSQTI